MQSIPSLANSFAPGERQITAQTKSSIYGFFSAAQDITIRPAWEARIVTHKNGVTWSIRRNVDTVVVHLGGLITSLATELAGCGSSHRVSAIVVKPVVGWFAMRNYTSTVTC